LPIVRTGKTHLLRGPSWSQSGRAPCGHNVNAVPAVKFQRFFNSTAMVLHTKRRATGAPTHLIPSTSPCSSIGGSAILCRDRWKRFMFMSGRKRRMLLSGSRYAFMPSKQEIPRCWERHRESEPQRTKKRFLAGGWAEVTLNAHHAEARRGYLDGLVRLDRCFAPAVRRTPVAPKDMVGHCSSEHQAVRVGLGHRGRREPHNRVAEAPTAASGEGARAAAAERGGRSAPPAAEQASTHDGPWAARPGARGWRYAGCCVLLTSPRPKLVAQLFRWMDLRSRSLADGGATRRGSYGLRVVVPRY
jgi:hypothetical protein